MKNEIIFTPPKWSFGGDNNSHDILNQKRGPNRRMSHHLIIIETLRAISGGKPTKDELQRLSHIKRARFISVLKFLIETESVVRSGAGTKFSPFVYALGEKELCR